MRVKVDEDLPVGRFLQRQGYDAQSVYEQGMSGWKDAEVFRAVRREARFLVTGDKGFGDIRRYPPGTHPGILVLRPARPSITAFLRLLEKVLQIAPLEDFQNCLVVAGPQGVRVRCPAEPLPPTAH